MKKMVLALPLLLALLPSFPVAQISTNKQPGPGNRWTGPFTLPRTDTNEGEIFAAALIPVGPQRGHVILWRDWIHHTPFPTYIVDPDNLPSPTASLSCGSSIPGLEVRCVQFSEPGCPALSFDQDGRLLAAAGHAPQCGSPEGSDTFNVFDPLSLQWLEAYAMPPAVATMNTCRHYPSGIYIPNDLPTGDLFAVFGGAGGTDSYEVYSLVADSWTQRNTVPTDLSVHDYTFLHLVPDGVLLSNPGVAPGTSIPTYYIDAAQNWIPGPPRSGYVRRFVGSVMLDRPTGVSGQRTQRVILFGGVEAPSLPLDCDDFLASNTIEWIDDPGVSSTSVWSTAQPVLKKRRTYVKAVVLPTGEVAILGGADHAYIPAAAYCDVSCGTVEIQATTRVEIYDPVTNTSSLRADEPAKRMYHSSAVLLPDGRIFSVGGDATTATGCEAGKDVTIYSPPYLSFPRPSGIQVTPSTVQKGGVVDIAANLPLNSSVAKVTLTAPGVSTHQTESHERYMELELLPPDPGFVAKAQIPFPIWQMQPGYYMLWLVLDTGAVSKAVFIRVTI